MAADRLSPGGLGRGRRSRRTEPRVSGSGPSEVRCGGIVPAVQAPSTIVHPPPVAHSLMPYLVDVRHLVAAARLCMRRASAPGVDGLTWAGYRRGVAYGLFMWAITLYVQPDIIETLVRRLGIAAHDLDSYGAL